MLYALAFVIKVMFPDAPAIVCPKLLKSLLLILIVDVVEAEPLGELIPLIAPAATALLSEIELLLIETEKVPVGVLLAAGI